jgi:pimeloyl-ACP methyl ester carboxylesterase
MVRPLWLLLLIPALPAAGMVYQWLGALSDGRRIAATGRLVEVVGGRRIYICEMGNAMAGHPTVVFESGIAATSQNWLQVQQAVAKYARTVSYDRAGLGWSSGPASKRTPRNIARELRETLQRAGIPGPYVVVGHSFGGLVARSFTAQYPSEVGGVVLVDAMRTEDWPPVNQRQLALLQRGRRYAGYGILAARLGLARLAITSLLCRRGHLSRALGRATGQSGLHVMDRITCEVGKMPREVWPIVAAHWSRPSFYRALAQHLDAVPASVVEMHGAAPLTGVPIVLLTPASEEPLSEEGLRLIGPAAHQVIAGRSGHWVHLDQPELVLDVIRGVFEQAGREASERAAQSLVGMVPR